MQLVEATHECPAGEAHTEPRKVVHPTTSNAQQLSVRVTVSL